MTTMLTTCLWFDTEGEAAAKFYTSVFSNSRITKITPYPEGGPRAAGSAMTVEFELDGRPFLALNGGPDYKHSPAISFMVPCKTQDELDRYWDRLVEGGQPVQCGWLTDKFGVSWQVFPDLLMDVWSSQDPVRKQRVMQAMMTMVKLDMAALQRAYDGA
jgi:predicted 3-demethylubiquinone-9 3-methyltransferase (glyoxalase superfamily)